MLTDIQRAKIMRRVILHPNVPRARKAKHWRDYQRWLAERNYAEVWERQWPAPAPYELVALVPHTGGDFT